MGFLVQLHVCAAMGSSSFGIFLSVLSVGLVKVFCTLVDGVIITDTLIYGGMSNIVHCGGIDYVIGTLGYVCVFSISSVVDFLRVVCNLVTFLI